MIEKISLAVATALLTTSAQAETIDFEAEAGGYYYFPYSFVEDGFRVRYEPISPFGFTLIDDPADNLGQCNPRCASNGTIALYAFNESSVTFDLENGGLFSLTSLDAAQTLTGNDRPLTLTLTGSGTGGVVTTTIFVGVQEAESFTNFTFADFTNLSSLTITGGPEFPEFAIDNVVLSAAAVPEPASWAMLIAGFGAVGGLVRRRQATVRLA